MESGIKRTSSLGQNNWQRRDKNRLLGWVALVIAVVVLVGVVYVGAILLKPAAGTSADIKKDKFQAVFLTNGQVYFGKIASLTQQGVTLTDIYYLQVQQGVQPDAKAADKDQSLSLAKLGNELHGPEDKMFINGDQMLFWENLKDDGKVVQAIKNNTAK